jgi:cyclic pyranopterin phosphate synthase
MARPPRLTHLDEAGAAHMVDVSAKPATVRTAVATGRIRMSEAALAAIRDATLAKGDALAVARIAGIIAAKETSRLLPLCHPLPLASVEIDFAIFPGSISVTVAAKSSGQTGIEMEALTATTVALLTLYDMAKAIDRAMVIEDVRLLAKSGGRSGDWRAPDTDPAGC